MNTKISFDDLFFDGKDKLIKRAKDFKDGKTKWSSFKILLHGKPGGGKTSFIKALQNELELAVFPIKLSQFDKIDDLIDTFHNPLIFDQNHSKWNSPIKGRCYLLEDIDAESDLVLKREDSDQETESDQSDTENKKEKKKKKGPKNRQKYESYWMPKSPFYDGGLSGDENNFYANESPKVDKLNLADLLNLLDGVLELNGCFIVMTTNHLEKLDDALVRDGRITYKLKLGEIGISNMKLMIKNFIPDYNLNGFNPKLQYLLEKLPPIMPCVFERLVKNEDNLDEVINNINNFILTS